MHHFMLMVKLSCLRLQAHVLVAEFIRQSRPALGRDSSCAPPLSTVERTQLTASARPAAIYTQQSPRKWYFQFLFTLRSHKESHKSVGGGGRVRTSLQDSSLRDLWSNSSTVFISGDGDALKGNTQETHMSRSLEPFCFLFFLKMPLIFDTSMGCRGIQRYRESLHSPQSHGMREICNSVSPTKISLYMLICLSE